LVTLIAFKPKNKILELNGQFKNSWIKLNLTWEEKNGYSFFQEKTHMYIGQRQKTFLLRLILNVPPLKWLKPIFFSVLSVSILDRWSEHVYTLWTLTLRNIDGGTVDTALLYIYIIIIV
jgi:hypothetical protein